MLMKDMSKKKWYKIRLNRKKKTFEVLKKEYNKKSDGQKTIKSKTLYKMCKISHLEDMINEGWKEKDIVAKSIKTAKSIKEENLKSEGENKDIAKENNMNTTDKPILISHTNKIQSTPTSQKIYGLRYVNSGICLTYTRLKDATKLSISRSDKIKLGEYTGRVIDMSDFTEIIPDIKRVILDNDGNKVATEGDEEYDDTLQKFGYSPDTHSVMVQIPKFYYLIRYIASGYEVYVGNYQFNIGGTSAWIHPAFYRDRNGDNTAEEVDYRYFPAFEGVLYDASQSKCVSGNELSDNTANVSFTNDLLCSFNTIGYDGNVDGLRPYSGLTIGEFRTLCENRNNSNQYGWGQEDFNLLCAIQALYKVVFADFDSQSILSKGFTKNSNAKPCGVGHTSVLNGKSGYVNVSRYYDGTAVVDSSDNVGTEALSLFGIENFYGNIYKWIDGLVTTSGYHIGIWNKDFSSLNVTDLSSADKDIDLSSVWTSGIDRTWRDSDNANSKYLGDIVKTTGGSSSSYYTNYNILNTGSVPYFGGDWYSGLNADAFSLFVLYSLSDACSAFGGALCL